MAAAYGALVFAVLGIAWSAIFIRWPAVPGPSSAFYRVFIAAAVLVPWWAATVAASADFRAGVRRANRRAVAFALAGGAFFAIDLALYNTAVLRTTATSATLLGNNAPIFVGIGTWLVFQRRPRRAFWMGLALAVIGAAIVMTDNAGRGPSGEGDPIGDMLALSAAVFFAAYLLTTERVREQLNT
ncbi:MAG: DMT family transporter, partial [Planctomycetaceae bacterium]